VLQRLIGGLCDLNAAGLSAATDLNLCLDDSYAADLLGSCLCFFRGVRHDASKHGYTVRLEHIARLIFKQVHGLVSFYVEVVSVQPDATIVVTGLRNKRTLRLFGNEPHGAMLLWEL